MRRHNIDLIIAGVLALCTLSWALLSSHQPLIGAVLAIPLVLLCPGYLLTHVLAPRRTLDVSHYLTFGIGLSMALDILLSLLLNFLPGGLQALSWAMALSLCTLILVFIVAYQRRKIQVERAIPAQRVQYRHLKNALLLGVALVVALFAIIYSSLGVIQQPHQLFTQFWLLPANQSNHPCTVQIGIQSFEETSTTYRVEINMNGAPLQTWSSIALSPQRTWQQSVTLTPGMTDTITLQAQLYRIEQPAIVYRKVQITLHVSKDAQGEYCAP